MENISYYQFSQFNLSNYTKSKMPNYNVFRIFVLLCIVCQKREKFYLIPTDVTEQDILDSIIFFI